MAQAEDSGMAPRLLSGLLTAGADATVGRVELARVAAWSMLQEPTDHAPYGWTHCLTMPQAVMALATRGVYRGPPSPVRWHPPTSSDSAPRSAASAWTRLVAASVHSRQLRRRPARRSRRGGGMGLACVRRRAPCDPGRPGRARRPAPRRPPREVHTRLLRRRRQRSDRQAAVHGGLRPTPGLVGDAGVTLSGDPAHCPVCWTCGRTNTMDAAPSMAGGPISQRVVDRPPFGPMERLDHDRLVAEQQATLASPRRRAGLSAARCS